MSSLIIAREDINEIKKKVDFYLKVNRFEAAEKLLKTTLTNYGPIANLHNLLGLTFHKQSRFAEALEQFDHALKANPNFIESSLNLTITLCDLGRYDEASKSFEDLGAQINAEEKAPKLILGRLANLHIQSAELYKTSGMLDNAISEYEKSLELFPDMKDARLKLAKLYLENSEPEKARKELDVLLSKFPNHAAARNVLGIIHHHQGRDDLAKSEWQKAAKIDPNNLSSRTYASLSVNW